jgi:tRNA pseudouridine65 synthase
MILYQDEFIIAVNKPNNMLVHHSTMANNMMDEENLIQLLQRLYHHKYFPIHRLDRKTSGIILMAKKKEFVSAFQELFITNKIQKTYFGIVRGFTPASLIINSDVKGRDSNVHKSAVTELITLKTIEIAVPITPYQTSRYSLVKLKPKTGRLHQLRIHLNKISHPLIGDPKYGDRFHNRMFFREFDCSNLFLHAGKIEFIHPLLNRKVNIKADFPSDWHKIADEFRWNVNIEI